MVFLPARSKTCTPSPRWMMIGGVARISDGIAIGCRIGLAFCSARKLLSRIEFLLKAGGRQTYEGQRFPVRGGGIASVEMDGEEAVRIGGIDIPFLVVD